MVLRMAMLFCLTGGGQIEAFCWRRLVCEAKVGIKYHNDIIYGQLVPQCVVCGLLGEIRR